MTPSLKILLACVACCAGLAMTGIAAVPLAPIHIDYTNDVEYCFVKECVPADITVITAQQTAGKGIYLQWSEDMTNWYFMDAWDPAPVDQVVFVGFYTPVPLRAQQRFYRAIETEITADFFAPFTFPPGAYAISRGTLKPAAH